MIGSGAAETRSSTDFEGRTVMRSGNTLKISGDSPRA